MVYKHTGMNLSAQTTGMVGKDQLLLAGLIHVMGKSFLLGLAISNVDLLIDARMDDYKFFL